MFISMLLTNNVNFSFNNNDVNFSYNNDNNFSVLVSIILISIVIIIQM